MNQHLSRAREYIAIAESADAKREAYEKAADEIIAAQKEDPTLSLREINRRLGKYQDYAGELVRWHTSAGDRPHLPFAGSRVEQDPGQSEREVRKAMSERPEVIEDALAEAAPETVERIARKATEVAVDRHRANRSEHQTDPPVRDLMDPGDRFDPSEHWADTLIIRVDENAHKLASRVQRAGGLILGSLSPHEAFEYLQRAEARIADVRAAAQEQIQDQAEVS